MVMLIGFQAASREAAFSFSDDLSYMIRVMNRVWCFVGGQGDKSALKRLVACALFAILFILSGTRTFSADNQLTPGEKKEGWLLLFDGQSLDEWMTSDGKPGRKPPEEGAINPHGAGHYMLVHKKKWSDFILALDFKISPGCNSGVFIRTSSLTPRPGKDVGYNGLEIAIDDTRTAGYVDTGALYDLSKPSRNAMKSAGEWNHLVVTARGSVIEIELNAERVNRIDLAEFTEPNKRPDGSAHKFDVAYKDHPKEGYIGLQDHGANCWFKNVKLKPIPRER